MSARQDRIGTVLQSPAIDPPLQHIKPDETVKAPVDWYLEVESQLRDTDFAAESAAYARHNIVYQAATAMLAQANQIPQTVLQMLR